MSATPTWPKSSIPTNSAANDAPREMATCIGLKEGRKRQRFEQPGRIALSGSRFGVLPQRPSDHCNAMRSGILGLRRQSPSHAVAPDSRSALTGNVTGVVSRSVHTAEYRPLWTGCRQFLQEDRRTGAFVNSGGCDAAECFIG